MFADSGWGPESSDGDLLPPGLEDAHAELIASYEVYNEAIPESTSGPNDPPWATDRSARPAHWTPANPSLYKITGVGFEELKMRLLKDAFTSLTTARLDENSNMLEGQQTYEAWKGNSRRGFFDERGIADGDYFCSNVNDEAIDVLCAIDGRLPGSISANTSGLSNELVYRVELGAFVLKIYLKSEDASAEHEFLVARNLLNFFFGAVHRFDEREQSFIEFFAKHWSIEPELASRWFSEGEWAELFLGPLDRCFTGYREDWIRPDYIIIQIQTSVFDPSFGSEVEETVVTYVESQENWKKTDFERVLPGPYLARLRDQANL